MKYLRMAIESQNRYCIKWNDPELNSDNIAPWTISPCIAEGKLIGGNLDTLVKLIKEYDQYCIKPKQKDILFLEDIEAYYFTKDSKTIGIHRDKFCDLEKSGFIKELGGLLIGRTKDPKDYNVNDDGMPFIPISYVQERKYIVDILKSSGIQNHNIPILGNISCSHTHPMVTLPLGRMVTLNANEQTLTVHPIESKE